MSDIVTFLTVWAFDLCVAGVIIVKFMNEYPRLPFGVHFGFAVLMGYCIGYVGRTWVLPWLRDER